MYARRMKRLQLYLEDELDEALAAQAVREHTSKAELIRRFVAERLGRSPSARDPLDALVGRYDEEPGAIDELVYGR
jgi:hypothetical protein